MQYGHVEGIDKPISRLVQGTVYFGDGSDAVAFPVFDAAFAAGCNTFDTAHVYGKGASERILGRWIASRGVRDQVVILDKGAHPMEGRARVTPEDITSDITDSLERLGTDRIDLYLLHRDNPAVPVEPIVDVLNEHHRAGRIKAFGGSNWAYERIAAANAYANANGLVPFAASSPQFSLAEMICPAWEGCISIGGEHGAAARAWYRQNQMAVFAWSSLAGGFMTGKFKRDNLSEFTDYFDITTINAYAHESNFARLDRAQEFADRKGMRLTELSLAYVLSQPLNLFALVGARTPDEFADNLTALEWTLTPDEIAWLDGEASAATANA